MAMRITGMNSGLDTESIIQELVSVKRTKVDTVKKAQTKLNWKQDAWKSLNTKLKNLQSKYLANMRFVSSYSKKTTVVSNSSTVSVITGENAVNGVQSLKIEKLAKTGYLTGAEIKGEDGSELTALSKLSDIDSTLGEGTISLKAGKNTVDIKVSGDTTISDVLTQMKSAGINASFDAKNKRFFISSKESGEDNDFSLTALDENGAKALSALGLQVSLDDDTASLKEYQTYASYYVAGDKDATLAKMRTLIDETIGSRTNAYLDQYKSLMESKSAAEKKIAEINEKYKDTTLESADTYKVALEAKNAEIAEKEKALADETDPDKKRAAEEELKTLKEEATALKEKQTDAETLASQNDTLKKLDDQIKDMKNYVDITENKDAEGNVTYSAVATSTLTGEVEDRYYAKASYANQVITDYNNGIRSGGATKVNGQNAIIYLNDAKFTNNTNVFEINGLTFTALNETKEGESITVTTQDDTQGMYDMIKDFLKEYNSVINEMDKLYNADSAKGYEPLTDEEKDAMSDREIEEWETKVKDALLRRDDNISTVSSALKSIMAGGITVNGKTMYLSDFGINTLGYFNAPDNEKNAYHIDGDPDDGNTSGNSDKLKSMIANDPDTVISFFSQLSKDLYAKMSDLSASVDGYRSYGNFYDDKKMKSDYTDYTSKIAELEEKLNDYEDKWYKKFSAMETALAKMQSNASAITGLLGG